MIFCYNICVCRLFTVRCCDCSRTQSSLLTKVVVWSSLPVHWLDNSFIKLHSFLCLHHLKLAFLSFVSPSPARVPYITWDGLLLAVAHNMLYCSLKYSRGQKNHVYFRKQGQLRRSRCSKSAWHAFILTVIHSPQMWLCYLGSSNAFIKWQPHCKFTCLPFDFHCQNISLCFQVASSFTMLSGCYKCVNDKWSEAVSGCGSLTYCESPIKVWPLVKWPLSFGGQMKGQQTFFFT